MVQSKLFENQNNIQRFNRLNPVIKWAGGKGQELKHILPEIPLHFDKYYEPFVGGGAIFFAVERPKMLINDMSTELIILYRLIQKQDMEFFNHLETLNTNWKLIEKIVENSAEEFTSIYHNYSREISTRNDMVGELTDFVESHMREFNGILEPCFAINIENFIAEIEKNLINKMTRMKVIEKKNGLLSMKDILDNVESALKSAFYMHFRHLYNNILPYKIDLKFATAIFYFIREFCYASMFRYNLKGEFNVPYGGIQYNRKNFLKKINSLQALEYKIHLEKTKIYNLDFERFFHETTPGRNDFIFVDPPYDSEFSTYAKNSFTKDDHIRLANYLGDCNALFMLVIKDTDLIKNLYSKRKFHITSFDKKYLVSFQGRNNKNAKHLIITNY